MIALDFRTGLGFSRFMVSIDFSRSAAVVYQKLQK